MIIATKIDTKLQELPISEAVFADIQTRIDACAFRSIKPYLTTNGGEIEAILVACGELDLAEISTFCVDTRCEDWEMAAILADLRGRGLLKQIILSERVKPEWKKYGWAISEIADDETIDCFYAPPLYFIKFRGSKWR